MFKRLIALLALTATLFITLVQPLRADGGLVVDPLLFAKLKEGQQVAVVTLIDQNSAKVDLFISILDESGDSHEVVYFVPLGQKANSFDTYEQDSLTFNRTLTEDLDKALYDAAHDEQSYAEALFAGALLTNGVWLTPLWLPLLLGSCGTPTPSLTFSTESSKVSVYDIDDSTDLEALTATSGLDPSVTQTLSRLKGQQVAVVNMRTVPSRSVPEATSGRFAVGEPGLHLSWYTVFAESREGGIYAYPLGTGAAWAKPIEMTRVYVVAPFSLTFSVKYPAMGSNQSGYSGNLFGGQKPRISGSSQSPAYATAEAADQKGSRNIWRAVYTKSNSTEDILITVRSGSSPFMINPLRQGGPILAFAIGAAVSMLFWFLAWGMLMPRLLKGGDRRLDEPWSFAMAYVALNALLLVVPGSFLFFIYLRGSEAFALLAAVVCFGGVGLYMFAQHHLMELGVSTWQALRAFAIVTVASSAAYLVFAMAYAKLAGVI